MFEYFEFISAVLFWVLVVTIVLIFVMFRTVQGHRLALNLFGLNHINDALLRLISNPPRSINKENIVPVISSILWRLTKANLIIGLVSLLPVFLLYIQNTLIREQNELFQKQGEQLASQIELMDAQNDLVDNQNRPYIRVVPHDNISQVIIYGYNKPAIISKLAILYEVESMQNKDIRMLDSDTLFNTNIYPSESSPVVIENIILTDSLIDYWFEKGYQIKRTLTLEYESVVRSSSPTKENSYVRIQRSTLSKNSRRWRIDADITNAIE